LNNRSNFSIINLVGKIFFPKDAPWQRRRKTLMLLWAIAAGAITGGIIIAAAFLMNAKH